MLRGPSFQIKFHLQMPGYVDFSFRELDRTHFGLGVDYAVRKELAR